MKEIEKQLTSKGIKRDVDVNELYLAKSNFKEIESLENFTNLQRLWLNGNKLRKVTGLSNNYRLSELYLNDNCIVNITGALRHLTCLKVLLLHGNQLEKLEHVIDELCHMQQLETLNLFANPVAQESEYRNFVILNLPTVNLLDRKGVLKSERDEAAKTFSQQRDHVFESVAFGRRVHCLPYFYDRDYSSNNTSFVKFDLNQKQPLLSKFQGERTPKAVDLTESEVENAVQHRIGQRSLLQFTHFDWSNVPDAHDQRINPDKKSSRSAQLITNQLR